MDVNKNRSDCGAGHYSHGRIHEDTCGCGSYTPSWIQRLANPKVFVFNFGVLMALNFAGNAYLNGAIPILERRFKLSSSESGTLTIINDLVNVCLIVFVSYFGYTSHRPRWIGSGCMLMAIGTLMCALPHYISEPYDTRHMLMTPAATNPATDLQMSTQKFLCLPGYQAEAQTNSSNVNCQIETSSNLDSVMWLIVGQIIAGMGLACTFPLAATYIEDAVGKGKVLSYMAFVFAGYGVGPIIGFLMSSFANSIYVNFDRLQDKDIPDIPQNDPRWIGAWWLGFIIIGIPMFFFAIPMFFFPRVMPSKTHQGTGCDKDCEEDDKAEASDALVDIGLVRIRDVIKEGAMKEDVKGIARGLFHTLKRIAFNVPLWLLVLSVTCESAALSAIASNITKFLVYQFKLSVSKASSIIASLVAVNILSHFVSAYIVRHFKLNKKQCALLITTLKFISVAGMVGLIFAGCPTDDIAGYTMPYENGVSVTEPPQCNADCSCSDGLFRPVCGSDGITYTSPCSAGCTSVNVTIGIDGRIIPTYYDCSCVNGIMDPTEEFAFPGFCNLQSRCEMFPVYLAAFFIVIFFSTLTIQPQIYTTPRIVNEDDRSVALGFYNFVPKILGFLPAPIYFGVVINSTCLLWQTTCGKRGNCWIFDMDNYRYSLHGIMLALMILSAFFAAVCYYTISDKEPRSEIKKQETEVDDESTKQLDLKV